PPPSHLCLELTVQHVCVVCAAPEILTAESYDKSVDMWSVGVLIYILYGPPPSDATHRNATHHAAREPATGADSLVLVLVRLSGYPPFYADSAPALFKKIM